MRVKYIAIDGTEFDESDLCETHESEIAKKDYERKFVDGSLAARADKMISIYESYCDARRMSDEHLKDEGSEMSLRFVAIFDAGLCISAMMW